MKELEKLKKEHEEAQAELEGLQSHIKDLNARHEKLRAEIPNAQEMKAEAEKIRMEALDRFVAGEINQEQLDQAKNDAARIEEEEREAVEMVEAIERLINKKSMEIPRISQKALSARQAVWKCLGRELGDEVKALVGDKFERAWVARVTAGQGSIEQFVLDVFGKVNSTEKIRALRERLKEEYSLP